MTVIELIILCAVIMLLLILVAVILYKQKGKPTALSMQRVEINKREGYLALGESEKLMLDDILNFRPSSQFHSQWNEYGYDHQKYHLVYKKDGSKVIVSLVVYDNEVDSLDKRDELNAIVTKLRYERVQKMKQKSSLD